MSDILSIVKDQEKELKAQVPSFLSQTANSSPSKLLGDYEKTGNPIFKKAAGQALEFLSTAVQKAKEWTAPKAEALGAGVMFAGMAATPRGRRMIVEEVAPTVFKGFDDVSTSVLQKLSGRSTVSKQFIQDSLKQADIKQAERNLINPILDEMGDVVDVNDFANRVKTEILPLERVTIPTTRYQFVNLPQDKKVWTNNYKENIYESPIQTSAGNIHFSDPWGYKNVNGSSKKYFAHTRTEDIGRPKLGSKGEYIIGTANGKIKTIKEKIRRVLEVQSDLMQKGRLEKEFTDVDLTSFPEGLGREARQGLMYDIRNIIEGKPTSFFHRDKGHIRITDEMIEDAKQLFKEEKQLTPYRNTWWNRIVRQEVKQAGEDGMTKIHFPVGNTAMEIEGLGSGSSRWLDGDAGDFGMDPEDLPSLSFDSVKVGKIISKVDNDGEAQSWVVTDVLGDGKFKAVPKDSYENVMQGPGEMDWTQSRLAETFDISDNVDKNNPIYKFYEDDIGKFLKNKFNAKRITDDKGVEWWEVDTGPYKGQPVLAHAAAPILGGVGAEESVQDNEDRSMFGKAMAGAGLFAGAMATQRGRRMIAEEVVNLLTEAKKYKSAEEFVTNGAPEETKRLFRVEPKQLPKQRTPEQEEAWRIGLGNDEVYFQSIAERGRLFGDDLQALKDYGHGFPEFETYYVDVPKSVAASFKRNHHGSHTTFKEYLLPQDIVNKKVPISQLTDIWNKAHTSAVPQKAVSATDNFITEAKKKLKNTWYGSADEIASVLSKPRMYTPDEQLSLFVEHIQPKLEKLKTPRDDQAVVFYQPADGVGGQYVNTRLEEVFHYPVDENLKVKVVPLSKLKSTGDDAKDSIGYRILDNSSSVEPIRGERGLFKGSKSLNTS